MLHARIVTNNTRHDTTRHDRAANLLILVPTMTNSYTITFRPVDAIRVVFDSIGHQLREMWAARCHWSHSSSSVSDVYSGAELITDVIPEFKLIPDYVLLLGASFLSKWQNLRRISYLGPLRIRNFTQKHYILNTVVLFHRCVQSSLKFKNDTNLFDVFRKPQEQKIKPLI